jgi:hypothetical protein
MAISTTAELNALYNNIYEDALVTLREENMMVSNNLVTQYSATGYAVRTISKFSKAAVTTKPEGVDAANAIKFNKTSAATFTPAVSMAQFLLTDEMRQTDTQENIETAASDELGAAIAEDVDVKIMSDFPSFTASKGTAGSALSYGHIGAAMAVLRNAKIRGSRSVVLHPYQWQDIWVELAKPATNYAFLGDTASEALRRYFVSNLEGATWMVSANVYTSGTDATGGVFAQEALGYDEREAYYIEPERDASLKAIELNAALGYAHGIIRNEAGVKILSDITEPTG